VRYRTDSLIIPCYAVAMEGVNLRVLIGLSLALLSWALYTQSNRFTSHDGDLLRDRLTRIEERLSNHPHGTQILPTAAIKIEALEVWKNSHMRDHRDNP